MDASDDASAAPGAARAPSTTAARSFMRPMLAPGPGLASCTSRARQDLAPSVSQDLLEERERPRVLRLAEPEHRLLADLPGPVGARDPDEVRHALVGRELAQRE